MRSSLLLTISILLFACSATPGPVDIPPPTVETVFVKPDCGDPPSRDKIDLRPIDWRILQFDDQQLFTLTTDAYEDLGYNVSQILSSIRQLVSEIIFYQDCVSRAQNQAEER